MSKQSLRKFLDEVHTGLQRQSSSYRNDVANRRTHYFAFTVTDLISQTMMEMQSRGIEKQITSRNVTSAIKKTNLLRNLRAGAQQVKRVRPADTTIRSNQHSISVVLSRAANERSGKDLDNFNKIKQVYKDGMQAFVDELIKIAKAKGVLIEAPDKQATLETGKASFIPGKSIRLQSDLFEGSHEDMGGVLETQLRDVVQAAGDKVYDNMSLDDLLGNMRALLSDEDAAVFMELIRNDADDTQTIFVGGLLENRIMGFLSGAKRKKLVDLVEKMMLRSEKGTPKIIGLKGSESVLDRQLKKVNIKTTDTLTKNLKNAKVKGKKEKLESPKIRSAKIKTNKVKNTATKTTPLGGLALTAKSSGNKMGRAKGSGFNLQSLIGVLNDKISPTVKNNMRAPHLENQTGRFADSVRITDVVKTAKGFPSVGYTYRKNPYQTFEVGFKQGSPDKDPRKLIDRSIREIAGQFAVGRFFTRRV